MAKRKGGSLSSGATNTPPDFVPYDRGRCWRATGTSVPLSHMASNGGVDRQHPVDSYCGGPYATLTVVAAVTTPRAFLCFRVSTLCRRYRFLTLAEADKRSSVARFARHCLIRLQLS